jgi:hypothetical protein
MKTKINHRSLQTPVSRSSRVFFCMKTFFLLLAGLTTFATASFAQRTVSTPTGGGFVAVRWFGGGLTQIFAVMAVALFVFGTVATFVGAIVLRDLDWKKELSTIALATLLFWGPSQSSEGPAFTEESKTLMRNC